jgi:hypothetical protein
MASSIDSSIIEGSFDSSNVASLTTAASLRKKTAATHQHLRDPYPNEEQKQYGRPARYCKYCTTKPYYSSVLSNLNVHLKNQHNIIVPTNSQSLTTRQATSQLAELYTIAMELDGGTDEIEKMVFQRPLQRTEAIQKALVNLVVVRNLPFRFVEWPEWHVVCGALNPESIGTLPSSSQTLVSYIARSFEDQKDIVRKRLQSACTSIHLSVDIWTSPNNHLFLAVCGHFINGEIGLQKAVLALRTVSGHSGENQWDTLSQVLSEYGVVHKIGAITADNSGTNDTLCRTIASSLSDMNISWNPVSQRLRCLGHIINLAVQDFLFKGVLDLSLMESYEEDERNGREITERERRDKESNFRSLGVLGKLHNINVYSRSSAGRISRFKTIVGRMIPLDNRTRWNSWFISLRTALEVEPQVDQYVKENQDALEEDTITPKDWKMLRTIYSFLLPFYRATMDLQGDSARIDKVLIRMDALLTHTERSVVRLPPFVLS